MRPGSPPASVFRSPRLIFELSSSQSSSTYRMGETLRQLYKLLFAFFGLAKQGTWLVAIGTLSIAGKGTRNGQGGACATTQDSRDEILLFVIENITKCFCKRRKTGFPEIGELCTGTPQFESELSFPALRHSACRSSHSGAVPSVNPFAFYLRVPEPLVIKLETLPGAPAGFSSTRSIVRPAGLLSRSSYLYPMIYF